ncbi:MAG: helix-turn-helix transcriptional regulator [Lachnospiraceae bacterium]|nr:helix-turn-helix transcriptional regulator [Lachnospiraceae bacterium]
MDLIKIGEYIAGKRKELGLTQKQVAEKLGMSDKSVSKWERGRGYPSLDSLKEISRYFGVSIDNLLSGEELLSAASEDGRQKLQHLRDSVFGLMDCSMILLLFLPLFGQNKKDIVESVSILSLSQIHLYSKIIYLILILGLFLCGVCILFLKNNPESKVINNIRILSLTLSVITTICFILSLQPYAGILSFIYLVIKGIMLKKS